MIIPLIAKFCPLRLLFLCMLMQIGDIYSQNNQLTADYHAICGEDALLLQLGKEEFIKYKNEVESQKFRFIATKQQAYFYSIPEIQNSMPELKIFTFLDTQKSLQVKSEIKTIIHLPRDFDWQMTTETKIIQGYTCYKAHSSYTVVRGDRIFTFPIIAWFTPEIPYPFGPKGYFGLPGLIMELQERNITYGVSKITFDNSTTQKMPNIPNYKSITEAEWEALALKRIMEE